jgi:hypothetical protein
MNRTVISLCFVISFTTFAYSDEGSLFDWESGTLEGWTTNTPSATLTPSATNGVTEGLYSMKIQGPGNTLGSENAMIDLCTIEGGVEEFFGNQYLSIDISVYQDEWAIDTAIGWTTEPTVSLILNSGSGQWWELASKPIGDPIDGTDVVSVSWNYGVYAEQIDGTRGVLKLILKFENYGYISPATYYVDDLMLISPEPTMMALLGIGGLFLIRRKK